MAQRTSLFFRAVAVIRLVGVLFAVVRTLASNHLLERVQESESAAQTSEIVAELRLWLQTFWWGDLVLGLLVLLLLALILYGLRGGRGVGLAATGVVLMALSLAFTVGDQITESVVQQAPGLSRRILWILLNIAQMAALGFPVAAGMVRLKRAGPAILSFLVVFAAFAFASSLLSGVMFFSEQPGDGLRWAVRVGWIGAELAFVVSAWLVAGRFSAEPPSPGSVSLAGSGLRLAAWSMLLRVVVVVIGGGISGVAAGINSFDVAKIAMVLTQGLGMMASLAMLLGLAGCLRLPKRARFDVALGVAFVATLLGIGLEIWSSSAGLEIYSFYEAAGVARSMEGMPNPERLDSLGAVVSWAGRAGQLLGLAGAVALILVLRRTAAWLDSEKQSRRAVFLVKLIVGVGVATLALGFLVEARLDPAYIFAGLGSLAVAAAAVAALVSWMRLLFGLARLVDDARGQGA